MVIKELNLCTPKMITRILGGSSSDIESVYIEDPYSSEPDDELLLRVIKEKYELKIVRDIYVLKITKLIDHGPFLISTHNNDCNVFVNVVFECEALAPKNGDIVIGAVCEVAGRGNNIPRLVKDKMIINVSLNHNMEQLIMGQKITLKIREINWNAGSTTIDIAGTLTHAKIYTSISYKVDPKVVLKHKELIDSYNQKIDELLKETKELKEYKEHAYPFTNKVNEYKDPVRFKDVFNDMIEGKIKDPVIMVDCCFLDKCDGEVYLLKCVVKELNTFTCINDLYEAQLKALTNLLEMAKEYNPWNKEIKEYYISSKKNHDVHIKKIKESLILK